MISTEEELRIEIARHQAECATARARLTSLAQEQFVEASLKGPLVEIFLRVNDVRRGHEPYSYMIGYTIHGSLLSDWVPNWADMAMGYRKEDGHPIYVFFDDTYEETRLLALLPGDMVSVAGYATVGLPTVDYGGRTAGGRRPFGVSSGRLLYRDPAGGSMSFHPPSGR